MQAPLEQDKSKMVRIVTIDIATGVTHKYAYQLTIGSGVSENLALNNHEFLVDERDGKGLGDGSTAVVKQLFKIDLAGATEVTGLTGSTADQIPSKIEGLAFVEDVLFEGVNLHTLLIANDNDFVPGVAGGNHFYVIGLSDADLGTAFVQQQIPEPQSLTLVAIARICNDIMDEKTRFYVPDSAQHHTRAAVGPALKSCCAADRSSRSKRLHAVAKSTRQYP